MSLEQIESLEAFFKKVDLSGSIKLNGHTVVTDMQKMVDTHLSFLKNNLNNETFKPYYDRLITLKKLLSK